jgi:hypothetical protein
MDSFSNTLSQCLFTGQRCYPEIPEEEAEMHSADQDAISRHQSDWKIYPIPANDELQLEWKVTDRNTTWQIRIMDMMGRLVLTDLIPASTDLHFMDLNGFPEGVFFITIYGQKGEVLHQAPIVIHR